MEPQLAEKKHQEESKVQHPEPLAHTKLLHVKLQWENRSAPTLPDASSKPAWETSSRPTGEQQASRGIPTATPGIKQHGSLDRLAPPPPPKKNNWIINKDLKRNVQQRGRGAVSTPEKEEGARSWTLYELPVNKGWKGRRANNGQVISHCLKLGRQQSQNSSPQPVSNIQSQTTLQNWKTISKPS
jgi:hypothetical protein